MFDWQSTMSLTPNMSLATGSPPPQCPPQAPQKYAVQFKSSIKALVASAEAQPQLTYNITKLCREFNFQRRRLYDVISILEALGCCEKVNVDRITWHGLAQIPGHLLKIQERIGATQPETDMASMFRGQQMILLSNLTVSFVLCFLVLQQRSLDIKNVAMFLSRDNGRFKSTLCKLYQITYILEAVGIVAKTVTPSQFILAEPYYAVAPIVEVDSPFSIKSLLNCHQAEPSQTQATALERRRFLFARFFIPHFYRVKGKGKKET